jgi:hypothetical protein
MLRGLRAFKFLARSLSVFPFALIVALALPASASPFRLLTTEAALNPRASVVVGLQEVGANLGPVFIDTNPLYDALLIENLGAKYVYAEDQWGVTVGARYIYFAGSNVLDGAIKGREPRISRFSLDAKGPMAFAGASLRVAKADLHFNYQYADISGSKISTPIVAAAYPISLNWDLVGELGYDFSNKQPRASLGITRSGPTFGWRLGVTYVKIDDPYYQYTGVAPIIDFFWLIGGSSGAAITPAPSEGAKL